MGAPSPSVPSLCEGVKQDESADNNDYKQMLAVAVAVVVVVVIVVVVVVVVVAAAAAAAAAAVVVVSDIWSIYRSQSINHGFRLILKSTKFGHFLRQKEAERLETGLERPRLQREIVGVLHDALECTLPDRHVKEVGQPQQLALDGMSVFKLIIADDQHRVSRVYVALVSCCPLPTFVYCKFRPLFSCDKNAHTVKLQLSYRYLYVYT